MRILLDVNVFQDALTSRPGSLASLEVLQRVEDGIDEGLISALTVPILWYLNHKARDARRIVYEIVARCEIAPLTKELLDRAYENTNIPDIEDAVQYETAKAGNCAAIITRNIADSPLNDIAVHAPEQYLASTRQ